MKKENFFDSLYKKATSPEMKETAKSLLNASSTFVCLAAKGVKNAYKDTVTEYKGKKDTNTKSETDFVKESDELHDTDFSSSEDKTFEPAQEIKKEDDKMT
jgi:hypothetical protein